MQNPNVADFPEQPIALDFNTVYRKNWGRLVLRSTSGFLYTMVLAILYALYILCLPYGSSIVFGMLLSVILHPRSSERQSHHIRHCVEEMRQDQQKWAQSGSLCGLFGSILSLRHFGSYALMRLVLLLGLNKLSFSRNVPEQDRNDTKRKNTKITSLDETPRGRRILRAMGALIVFAMAHMMLGVSFFIGMHILLFLVFALSVPLMPEERFVIVMWRVWRAALILFFVTAVTYNLALDVLSISDAVKRTTSAVVNAQREWTGEAFTNKTPAVGFMNATGDLKQKGTPTHEKNNFLQFQEFVLSKARQSVLKEVAEILNQTNATELAVVVSQGFAPMATVSMEELSFGMLVRKGGEFYRSLFSQGAGSFNWVAVVQKLMERWQPFLSIGAHAVVLLGSNMMGFFDSIYAFMLFVFVLRYFTQLEHTILYYVIAKMLKVLHPKLGEAHARHIEEDITMSFFTLLQSFWHLTWFHFCVTFCLFKTWSFTTPLLCGAVSSFTAVFPLMPKWLSPLAFALAYSLFESIGHHGLLGAATSLQVWWCLAAFIASYADEWLLSVSRGMRGEFVLDSTGVKREQLPTFVVGTALVLGYVSYGVRGILLGPMTIIVAKVLFDNWDLVFEQEDDAAAKSGGSEHNQGTSEVGTPRSGKRVR